jgi:hypothetical protein
MNLFDGLASAASVAVIIWSFSYHRRRLGVLKRRTGTPVAGWSEYFSASLPSSYPRWVVIALYLTWCAIQVARNPGGGAGYLSLLLLGIFLSFAPRRNVYLGPNGMVRRMRFFPWSEFKEIRIVERRRSRYLVSDIGKLRLPKKVTLPAFERGRGGR